MAARRPAAATSPPARTTTSWSRASPTIPTRSAISASPTTRKTATRLKLLGVDNETGAGCIKPSAETIADGTYAPLSRPIFIYPKISSLDKPEVREFVRFYVNPANTELISQTGYIPFPQAMYERATQRLNSGAPGTVFTRIRQPGRQAG